MENHKGNTYLKCCHEVTAEQIVRIVPEYVTFNRNKTNTPKYDAVSGEIEALYTCYYSATNTPLGEHWKTLTGEDETLLRCFAHCLLIGEVFPAFKKLKTFWLSPPAGKIFFFSLRLKFQPVKKFEPFYF